MKKFVQAFVLTAFALFSVPALAGQVRELTWEDLSPTPSGSDDPLENLTQEQFDLLLWVLNVLETSPTRDAETEDLYQEVDKAMPVIKEAGIDIDGILEERKKARTSVVEELDGQRVRVPGYLLPLEMSGTQVIEFFLVPYVGACIHVPPPPPNQIVHVVLAEGESYESKKLFEPVWVTGIISATSTTKELYLVDGSADIHTGYSMKANQVEPYQ